jgi:hypothetical protein
MKIWVFRALFALGNLIAFSQQNSIWAFDSLMLRFDWNGIVSLDTSHSSKLSSETALSSENENWIYYTGVNNINIFNGGLYNENNQLIHASADLNMSRTTSSGKFLPYSTSNSIGFVSQR